MNRGALLRRGMTLETVTIGWNVIEGLVAVGAGWRAGSVALTAFGLDSFIETTSAAVLWLHLRSESRRGVAGIESPGERRAARMAGALLMALAAVVCAESLRRLAFHESAPEESAVGIVLTVVSLVVMPVLAREKLRVAAALESRALRADAFETISCAWLSATTLGGLVLNSAFGWGWADPVAGLILVPLIFREGLEGWRGGCGCAEED